MTEAQKLSIEAFKKIAEEGLKLKYGEQKGRAIYFLLFGGFGVPGLIDDASLAAEAVLSINPKEVGEKFTAEAATSFVTELAAALLKNCLIELKILPEVFVEAAGMFITILALPSDTGDSTLPTSIRNKITTAPVLRNDRLPKQRTLPIPQQTIDLSPAVVGSRPGKLLGPESGDGRARASLPKRNAKDDGDLPNDNDAAREGGGDGRGRAAPPRGRLGSRRGGIGDGERNVRAEGDGRGRASLPVTIGGSRPGDDGGPVNPEGDATPRGPRHPMGPDGIGTPSPRPSGQSNGPHGPKPSTPDAGDGSPKGPYSGGIPHSPRGPGTPSSPSTGPAPKPTPDSGPTTPKPAPKPEPKTGGGSGDGSSTPKKPKKKDEPVPPGIPPILAVGIPSGPRPKPPNADDRSIDKKLLDKLRDAVKKHGRTD